MSSLLIVKPVPIVGLSQPVLSALLTPDPKEAATMGDTTLVVDFGAAVTIDSVFLGYHTAINGNQWAVSTCDSAGNSGASLVGTRFLQSPGYGPPYHAFYRANALTSRYFRLDTNKGDGTSSTFLAGVLAFGLSFQPTYGHEYGSGRPVFDTGSAERLFGGGFGINEGARVGGWQWTMGDLTDAEIRALYRIALDRGTTRSVLVVEDPDQTDGLNERIHWGLFDKLDPYERFAPGATRWGLRINDWA